MHPFEHFSDQAMQALNLAEAEASRRQHTYFGTEHVLTGLLLLKDSSAAVIVNSLGTPIESVLNALEAILEKNQQVDIKQLLPTTRVKAVIEISFSEARRMASPNIGTEHLLLGILIEGKGIAAQILVELGVSLERARAEVERLQSR